MSHDNQLSFLQQEVLYAWNVFVLLVKNPPLLHNMLRYTWTELLIVEDTRGELPFTLLLMLLSGSHSQQMCDSEQFQNKIRSSNMNARAMVDVMR